MTRSLALSSEIAEIRKTFLCQSELHTRRSTFYWAFCDAACLPDRRVSVPQWLEKPLRDIEGLVETLPGVLSAHIHASKAAATPIYKPFSMPSKVYSSEMVLPIVSSGRPEQPEQSAKTAPPGFSKKPLMIFDRDHAINGTIDVFLNCW